MKLLYVLFATLIVLFATAFSAWGIPQPLSWGGDVGDDRQISINGKDFGSAPELNGSHLKVESVAGLKSCVLLAEYPVLDQCNNLTILPVIDWNEVLIITKLRNPLPTDPQLMYLYVIDDEGNRSYPAGPLDIVAGIPAASSKLKVKEVEIQEVGWVKTLEPSEPEPKENRPGQTGQPIRQ